MRTVFNYLEDYGDMSFEQKPLCEGDFVAFGHISSCLMQLVHFENVVVNQEDVVSLIDNYDDSDHYWFWQDEYIRFLKLFFSCSRFKEYPLSDFRYLQTFDNPCQYDIATFTDGDTAFVSFGGAGIYVKTFEEAARIAYTVTNAQKHAVKYLNDIASKVNKIYITGFSKGGSAALYAALKCHYQEKIQEIYSFETPLLSISQMKSKNYSKIKPMIKYYVPQLAFIGMVYGFGRPKTVCHSHNKSVYQHDASSWEFCDDTVKRFPSISNTSKYVYFVFHEIVYVLDNNEMKILIEGIIKIFNKLGYLTCHHIIRRTILNIPRIIFYLCTSDKDFKRVFKVFRKTSIKSIGQTRRLFKETKKYKVKNKIYK